MAPLLRGSAQGPPATRGNRLSGSGTRIIYYTILKISVIWITPEPVKAANCGSSGRKRHQPDGTRRSRRSAHVVAINQEQRTGRRLWVGVAPIRRRRSRNPLVTAASPADRAVRGQ
jgi:hypothetical protein